MLFRKLIILLFLFLITCNDPVQHSPDKPQRAMTVLKAEPTSLTSKAEYIDSIFQQLSKYNWFNGSVCYSEKGQLVYQKAFGFKNFKTRDSLTVNSPFQLASVSKMFTAISIMILKERDILDYEDTIQQFIPDFPHNGISIRNLLTHRAGLSRYMSLAHDKWKDKTIPLSNDSMLSMFERFEPNTYFKADAGFHYCNTNYAILASIVEKASGKPFDVFMKEEVFDPLEMNDSFVYNMRGDTTVSFYVNKGVTGHRNSGWRSIRMRNDYLNGVMGDKGVYCSIEDMFKFEQALYFNTLVSQETLSEAYLPGSPKYWRRNNNYGFGWRIKVSEDSTVFHFGWWKGFRAYFIRDLKQDKSIIALCNKERGPGSQVLWNILRDTAHEIKFEEVKEFASAN